MSRDPVRLHRVIDGPADAPVLVLADSLGSTLEMWDAQVATLADRFRVVRFDLRGHGGSPVPAGPYSIADLGGDVVALLDELGVRRAHVAGLSLGGMIAMWLAARAPERVDRLVLLATSARMDAPEAYGARAELVLREGMGVVAEPVVGRWFTPGYAAAHPATIERMRAMVASIDPVGYAGCCQAIAAMDLTGELPAIGAPTLVVMGADDRAIPPVHGARLVAGIAGARLAIVPDAAHLLNIEQPAEVGRLMIAHLEREPAEDPR